MLALDRNKWFDIDNSTPKLTATSTNWIQG